MNKIAASIPPYESKADFLAVGLWATTIDKSLDCSICREPLATSTTAPLAFSEIESAALYRFPILPCTDPYRTPGYNTNNTQIPNLISSKDSSDMPLPEAPIRISPCNHIFGSTCIQSWFANSTSNRCPECDTTLFPQRIHLTLRRPTRVMRLEFARFIEQELEDGDTAALIRESLTSERVSTLIRNLVVEMHRASGLEVSWEYVGDELVEEDEEDEDLMESAEEDGEMASGSEYESDEEEDED
jgi:hypothetical protein